MVISRWPQPWLPAPAFPAHLSAGSKRAATSKQRRAHRLEPVHTLLQHRQPRKAAPLAGLHVHKIKIDCGRLMQGQNDLTAALYADMSGAIAHHRVRSVCQLACDVGRVSLDTERPDALTAGRSLTQKGELEPGPVVRRGGHSERRRCQYLVVVIAPVLKRHDELGALGTASKQVAFVRLAGRKHQAFVSVSSIGNTGSSGSAAVFYPLAGLAMKAGRFVQRQIVRCCGRNIAPANAILSTNWLGLKR